MALDSSELELKVTLETNIHNSSPSGTCQFTLECRGWLCLGFRKSRENALWGDLHLWQDICQRVVRWCCGRCRCFQATAEVAGTGRSSWRRSWCRTDPWWQKDELKKMQYSIHDAFHSMKDCLIVILVTEPQIVPILTHTKKNMWKYELLFLFGIFMHIPRFSEWPPEQSRQPASAPMVLSDCSRLTDQRHYHCRALSPHVYVSGKGFSLTQPLKWHYTNKLLYTFTLQNTGLVINTVKK